MNAITKITTPRPGLIRPPRQPAAAAAGLAERAGGGQPGRQQQVGNRQQHVDAAGDQGVRPAAEVAGQQAGDDPGERRQRRSPRRRRSGRRGRRRSVRLKTSRPIWSTPKMCALLGPVGVAKNGSRAPVSRSSGAGRAEELDDERRQRSRSGSDSTRKISEAIASRSSRKRRQKSSPRRAGGDRGRVDLGELGRRPYGVGCSRSSLASNVTPPASGRRRPCASTEIPDT